MCKTKFFLVIICCLSTLLSTAQTNDKATLYIVRTSSLGAAINFKYFIDDQYVGKFKYGKYLKLDVEPGEHVIWAKAENRSYVQANFEGGKTYLINAIPKMGALKASVDLKAVNNPTEKEMGRINKYLQKKKLMTYDEDKRMLEQKDYADMIVKGMAKYEEDIKGSPELEILVNPIELQL